MALQKLPMKTHCI